MLYIKQNYGISLTDQLRPFISIFFLGCCLTSVSHSMGFADHLKHWHWLNSCHCQELKKRQLVNLNLNWNQFSTTCLRTMKPEKWKYKIFWLTSKIYCSTSSFMGYSGENKPSLETHLKIWLFHIPFNWTLRQKQAIYEDSPQNLTVPHPLY